jgi:hypothetical protein
MFPRRFYPGRFFAPRYFPVGADVAIVVLTIPGIEGRLPNNRQEGKLPNNRLEGVLPKS